MLCSLLKIVLTLVLGAVSVFDGPDRTVMVAGEATQATPVVLPFGQMVGHGDIAGRT